MHDILTPTMVNTSTPKPTAQKLLMVPIFPLGSYEYTQDIMFDVST